MAKITPLLLGIGGDSGTGKSTFVGGIYKIFGPEKITNINLDDYQVYDHSTGCFAEPEEVEPRQIVIIGGLLPFFTQELRDVFDLKVYLDPDEELKRAWKIQRDAGGAGTALRRL